MQSQLQTKHEVDEAVPSVSDFPLRTHSNRATVISIKLAGLRVRCAEKPTVLLQ